MPIDFCLCQPYLADTYPDPFLKVLVRVHYTVSISRDEAVYGQAELQGHRRPPPTKGSSTVQTGAIYARLLTPNSTLSQGNGPRYNMTSFNTDHSEI
jgi:hypothetical protein